MPRSRGYGCHRGLSEPKGYPVLPRGRSDLHDGVIDFVARQVGVDGSEVVSYEWSGRTIEYHRAQIRAHLGFRVATVADQEEMTA